MAAAVPSIPSTGPGIGTGPHGNIPLGGPLFLFLRVLGYAAVIGAVAVVIDSLRRPEADFGGNRAGRWMWAIPQALLLALIVTLWALVALVPATAAALEGLAGFLSLYLLVCAILQVSYLLVVVFPRRREPIPDEVEKELPRD